MISGTIKMWKEVEGWGFIEGDDGDDYFVNITNVRIGQKLLINVRVKFDVTQGHRGPEAENVSLF
jgi:CspA family cold shock protein